MTQSIETARGTTTSPAIEASRRLARSITASPPFQRFQQAHRQLEQDPPAKELLSEFQQAQQIIQMMSSWGGAATEESQQLERLRQQLLANVTLKELLQAQDDLVEMLQEVNVFVSEKLGVDFATLTKPAGGCC